MTTSVTWTGDNLPEVQAFCGPWRNTMDSIDLYIPRFFIHGGVAYLTGPDASMEVPVGSQITKDGHELVVHEFA